MLGLTASTFITDYLKFFNLIFNFFITCRFTRFFKFGDVGPIKFAQIIILG